MKEDKYKLKNRTRMSTALDTELWERLKKVSNETMIPMSKLLDKGIEMILQKYEKNKVGE